MMIITALFLFALGTKFGGATPIKTEVKYEGPNKITISEDTSNGKIFLPGPMRPYGPNFIHQGSNFFFNPQVGFIPPVIDTIIPPNKDCETVNIVTKPEIDIIVEEPAVEIAPIIEMDPIEIVPLPELPIVIPEIINIEPIPQEVEVEVSALPAVIPAAPELPYFDIPELPLPVVPQVSISVLPEVAFPQAPVIIEEPIKISEIPPPPVLPPLVIADIPKPVLVEEKKKVILVPAAPELPAFVPSQVVIAERPLLPTKCVQNIVLERVLPHIMYENTQRLELISFPAARTIPVVNSPFNFYK